MGLKSKHKINSYLIYLEHNLKDYFYFIFLSLCVCVHDAYVWVLVPQQESGSQRPSPVFSHLFEGSEVRTLATKLVQQELYPLRHLIGPNLKQFYTILLAYIVFGLRPIRQGQLGIFSTRELSFGLGMIEM